MTEYIRNAPAPALKLPRDFQAMLDEIPPASTLGLWIANCSDAALDALTAATVEAGYLPDGKALLPMGVTLAFRDDLSVRYIRECCTDDEDGGCFFLGYLFTVPDRLQVAVWVEDDLTHAWMVYRGDHGLVEEIGLEAKLFEGRCFAGTVGPEEPYQHIVRVR